MIEKIKKYVEKHKDEEPTKNQLKKKINSLENEVESLKSIIVEDAYEIKRLKALVKKLKQKDA